MLCRHRVLLLRLLKTGLLLLLLSLTVYAELRFHALPVRIRSRIRSRIRLTAAEINDDRRIGQTRAAVQTKTHIIGILISTGWTLFHFLVSFSSCFEKDRAWGEVLPFIIA